MEHTNKQENKAVNKRRLEGVVTSDKMMKTIVVSVTRVKTNEKYQKQYKSSRKFKAHDEDRTAKIGDLVVIEETRPISKDKRWRLVKIVKSVNIKDQNDIESKS